jgi:uncharacterized protein YeaO (DUF488 family)
MITLRRVYEQEEADEGYRIFIDRLWPRGLSKEKATWDEWMKDVSPSNELRRWFSHDPSKWEEFRKLYKKELADMSGGLEKLRQLEARHGTITLLYSSREERYNNAVALKEFLTQQDV